MDDRPAQPGQLTGEKGVNDYHNGDNLGLEPTTPSPEPPAAPQAAPSDEYVSVVGMPEFDALLDHIYEYGTASEGIIGRANAFARALLARYGAQPAASAELRCRKCGERANVSISSASLVTHWSDGTPRDERDIASDPEGKLIHDPSEPLRAAPVDAQAQSSGNTGELPASGERATFDQWFCRERGLPMDADTTQYDEAFLAYLAWQDRAALAAQAKPKRRPYNASGSLSEYGIFPECDAAPVAQPAASDEHLIETGCYQTVIDRHSQPAANQEPSDEEIEALALAHGINKSDEHWGARYYTELGSSLFRFARALLSRYGRPARDADEYQAMLAVMEQIDPATFPGLTAAQRCALGRFAKPVAALPQRSAGE